MEDILVIGLSGFKRSGKDMVANYLIEQHNFMRVSFADPLKEMAAKEFNVNLNCFYDDNYKEYPILNLPVQITDSFIKGVCDLLINEFRSKGGLKPNKLVVKDGNTYGAFDLIKDPEHLEPVYWTPRALAIFKGSGNRAVESSYWNQKAVDLINFCSKNNQLFVISDLRFKTEVSFMKEKFGHNFISVRVDRFDNTNTTDPSEMDLVDFKFDYRVNNSQISGVTKDQVFSQVNDILKDLIK